MGGIVRRGQSPPKSSKFVILTSPKRAKRFKPSVTKMQLPNGKKFPLTLNTWLHNEDIDLSGGAGAIAAALAAGNLGHELNGTDGIMCPRPINYLGFVYADEQSAAADADGNVTIGNKRAFEIPLEVTDPHNQMKTWFPSPLKLASRENVAVTGRSTGAGAEQHSCIHYVDDPGLGPAWEIKPVGSGQTSLLVAQVTAALVAQTISGFTDICGRTTAYVGGQRTIPNTPNIGIVLHAITPFHGAGYSGICIRHPQGTRQICLMGQGGAATGGVTALKGAKRYDFTKMFGGGLYCKADQPFQLGAFGVGTTAQWALLEMELIGVGDDG